jgi:hypothetical protein
MFTRQSFTAHGATIGIAEHLMHDLFDALVLKALLLLFDKVGVFYHGWRRRTL